MFTELLPETTRRPALWGELDRDRREQAWKVMDKLNATLGRDTCPHPRGTAKGCRLEAQSGSIARRDGLPGGTNFPKYLGMKVLTKPVNPFTLDKCKAHCQLGLLTQQFVQEENSLDFRRLMSHSALV